MRLGLVVSNTPLTTAQAQALPLLYPFAWVKVPEP